MTNRGEQTFDQKRKFKELVDTVIDLARQDDVDACYALALMIRLDDSSTISPERLRDIAIFLLGNDEMEHVLSAEDRRGSLVKALDAKYDQIIDRDKGSVSPPRNGQSSSGDLGSSSVAHRPDPDSSRPIFCPDRL
ncbi:MAG TPA: hypothetical protein PKB15_01425 [Acidimicrobiia bacterium]|mgnify:CR=1 FL=1|nr:hypothetical protein [Acidimicrobiia bacterium]